MKRILIFISALLEIMENDKEQSQRTKILDFKYSTVEYGYISKHAFVIHDTTIN